MGIPREKIFVIHVPINSAFFSLKNPAPNPNLLIFAGWFQKRKGLEVLLEAMPEVIRRNPEVKLEVFGAPVKWENDYLERVMMLSDSPELRGHVKVMGKASQKQLGERMKEAGIVIVPEQWENMSPLILLESMLSQKIVVAGNIGGIPEFVQEGKNGLLFCWNDPKDLAEKICYAISNFSNLWKNFGEEASSRIQRIVSPAVLAGKFEAFYKQLVEK
jgi:glycosyltransferase involved in cell wall biosynthesis